MSVSDSMFLFEIVVEEVKSFVQCREFNITSQFADLFTLNLKDPTEVDVSLPKRTRKKKRKSKVRERDNKPIKVIKAPPAPSAEPRIRIGQSILIVNNVDSLKANMKACPLQLTLWDKIDHQRVMGSTDIPWSPIYIDYLNNFIRHKDVLPVAVDGLYNVFDELTSRRMATVQMSIKLSCLKDRLTTEFRALSEDDPDTFVYTGFNSKPTTIISKMKKQQEPNQEVVVDANNGKIKTTYSGGKTKRFSKDKTKTAKLINKIHSGTIQPKNTKTNPNRSTETSASEPSPRSPPEIKPEEIEHEVNDLGDNRQISLIKAKSYSSLQYESNLNTLNYIFGEGKGPFGNQVYCVGYFTVQNDPPSKTTSILSVKKSPSSRTPSKQSVEKRRSSVSIASEKLKIPLCGKECPSGKRMSGSRSLSHISIDVSKGAAQYITVKKCNHVDCNAKKHKEPPTPPDDRILIDFGGLRGECCKVGEKIEEVVGGMKAKMKVGDEHPCYCTCECTFGFTKKTTYCKTCGGYELSGDELYQKPAHDMPFPCPIFHKLIDKRGKSFSASGSDSKKNLKAGRKIPDKSSESEKEGKKGKKKKKDDRFKFNYGYQGIPPQIGHSHCAMPCTGTLGNVPKRMGWLWTADDVPGMKFRPNWKPGAISKYVVRLLRMAKNPGKVISKRRRRDAGKKRPLKRPLLIVHKKDGEFTVTMETMKAYSKPRALNQHPYEDKPVITYTIGRSDEENRERRKKKERAQRRLERCQRDFIQSAFRDMCEDICLKTYQQALGILPDTEDPRCRCYPAHPGPDRTNLDVSCSCSEDSASLCSDTDSDEWVVEFTPPNALFDPTHKGKRLIKVDNGTQYTYMDYRVKLTDRFGNPVPRFFKGPDGKQQCSDLGGFWSPDHKWLEINVDGYIAPDNRWAPNSFLGPNGEQVDAEGGKFQAANGKWLVVGVDGYVDSQGKWKFYPKPRASPPQKKQKAIGTKGVKKGDDKKKPVPMTPSVATWSCFGDASPKDLGKMGIIGHGLDRKLLLQTLKKMLDRGEDVTIPKPSVVPRRPESKKGRKVRTQRSAMNDDYYSERTKCRHPVPSEKGIVAVDAHGNKAYFRLKNYKNTRPKQRLRDLTRQGISLSSFHLPCFHSFINSEIMKQEQRERLNALATGVKSVGTHASQ